MFKFIIAGISPKKARAQRARKYFLELFDFVCHVCCVFDENWTFLKSKLMSAYDITEFLRTAYRPFAYYVPSKFPLNTAYRKGGGVTLIYDPNKTRVIETDVSKGNKNRLALY